MFNIKFPDKLLDGAIYFFFLFPSYAFDVIPCYTFKCDRDMNDKLFYRITALISGCSCGINFGMLLRDISSAEKEIFINLLQTQLWLIYQHTANGISSSNGISVTDETCEEGQFRRVGRLRTLFRFPRCISFRCGATLTYDLHLALPSASPSRHLPHPPRSQ